MKRAFIAVSLLACTGVLQAEDAALIEQGDWRLVQQQCSACHSLRLVTQNRGSAADWIRLIRWMQDTQGLWPLPEATERAIVEYLGRYYPPAPALSPRRAPLPAGLRPEPGAS